MFSQHTALYILDPTSNFKPFQQQWTRNCDKHLKQTGECMTDGMQIQRNKLMTKTYFNTTPKTTENITLDQDFSLLGHDTI
jgi:hypothetical protein